MTPDDVKPEIPLDEVLPAEEPSVEPDLPSVLPAPGPPHPNIWWSLLWCFGILATLYGTVIGAMIVLLVGGQIASRIKGGQPNDGGTTGRVESRENGWLPKKETEAQKAEEARLARERIRNDLFKNLAFPMLLGEVVTTLLAVATLRVFVGKNWMRVVGLRRPGVIHVVLVLIGLPAMLILPNMIHELAKEIGIPSLENPEEFAQMIGGWSLGFGVLVVGVGPGLSEELWCRGFLGRGLVGNYGVWIGVLFTSALFGMMHVDPAHAIATAAIGLWLHFTYLMTRSLFVPMVLHTLNNSLAVLGAVVGIQLEAMEKHPESAHPPNVWCEHVATLLDTLERLAKAQPYLIAIGCTILLGAVAWALYSSRTRLVVSADETAVPWRPDFPGVEYPPPGSVTKIYRPWPGWLAFFLVLAGILAFAGSTYYAYLQT